MQTKLTNLYAIDYINLYFKKVYDEYGQWRQSVPCIYYSLDMIHSTFDNEYFQSGNYEFVGDLSGWVWKKIYYMPIHEISPLSVRINIEESGLNQRTQIDFSIAYKHGLRPIYNDIVLFDDNIINDQSTPITYVVTDIEKLTVGKGFGDFKCTANYKKIDIVKLNSQVNDVYIYIPFLKQFYIYEDALKLIEILEQKPELEKQILDNLNRQTGLFLL